MNLFPSFVVDKRRFYSKNSTHLFVLFPNKGKRVRLTSNYIQLLLIGLCLGITLGIAFIPMFEVDCFNSSLEIIDENGNLPVSQISDGGIKSEDNNRETRSMKMRRPRFFSTELGLRKKLIAGIILTDYKRIDNLIAINRTLSPLVDQVLFFVVGQKAAVQLKSLGISNLVILSNKIFRSGVNKNNENLSENDNDTIHLDKSKYSRIGLKAIKYFGEKFIDSYDYFFVGLDVFYVNGRVLMNSAKRISISQEVFLGNPDENGMCKLEKGVLLSRSIVRKLSLRLDRCLVSNALKMGSNIKTCIQYALGSLQCMTSVQNETYLTVPLEDDWNEVVTTAISIGPVSSAQDIYHLHVIVSEKRMMEIDQEINKLTGIIDWLTPYIPKGFKINSWPKGLPEPFEPHTRFDVLKWKYFTANKLYPKNEHITETSLDGIETLDISSVVNISMHYLQDVLQQKNESSLKFQSGYRRFDETRGMEYILDFLDVNGENHRVESLRPLSRIEVVPMPFVMENRRVTIVIPITLEQFSETDSFLTSYLDLSVDKKSNAVLVLAIIIRDSTMDAQKSSQFTRLKHMISEHNTNQNKKYNNGSSTVAETDTLKVGYVVVNMKHFRTSNSILATFDMLSSRVLSPNSLVLAMDVFVKLKDDFLNRVRMNTILDYQVFSPIPFAEYNPKISGFHYDYKELEIHKSTGYFDSEYFGIISFFIGDYTAARKNRNFTLHNKMEFFKSNGPDIRILSKLFLERSQVHFLRAPEPTLKLRFSPNFFDNCSINGDCFKRKWGSKAELAKLVLRSRS